MTVVHPREVFRQAISDGAHSIILLHNHPTGDPSPSQEDRNLTRRLVEVSKIVGIDKLFFEFLKWNFLRDFYDELLKSDRILKSTNIDPLLEMENLIIKYTRK